MLWTAHGRFEPTGLHSLHHLLSYIISNRHQIYVAGPSFLWSNDSFSDVNFNIVARQFGVRRANVRVEVQR